MTVKAGYARNYLIPQGLACMVQERCRPDRGHEARSSGQGRATREEAVAAKELIEGSVVEIAAKVSESGKLFGGISADKIAIALSSKADVNPKNITVDPIKTTGEFAATVALHPEITASFTVKVVAE
ncbi:MAG: 50S ribosomal protein L9 [Bifidobacterium pseudocatenulatum]